MLAFRISTVNKNKTKKWEKKIWQEYDSTSQRILIGFSCQIQCHLVSKPFIFVAKDNKLNILINLVQYTKLMQEQKKSDWSSQSLMECIWIWNFVDASIICKFNVCVCVCLYVQVMCMHSFPYVDEWYKTVKHIWF